MRIVRKSQEEIWPEREAYHVLTYAEEGFAPLNIHARSSGIANSTLASFAETVNNRMEVGSLFPRAPISAVPRRVIREDVDSAALLTYVIEFLRTNAQEIKSTKLICDFRTPKVPLFVHRAVEQAMESEWASSIEEVVIVE